MFLETVIKTTRVLKRVSKLPRSLFVTANLSFSCWVVLATSDLCEEIKKKLFRGVAFATSDPCEGLKAHAFYVNHLLYIPYTHNLHIILTQHIHKNTHFTLSLQHKLKHNLSKISMENSRLAQLREQLVRLDEERNRVQNEINEIIGNAVEVEVDDSNRVILADSARTFYLHGDRGKRDEDQYCLISFLPRSFKCERNFWGVLLGLMQNNELWVMHVDGWIKRSLMVHKRVFQIEPSSNLRKFAVMPTIFNGMFTEANMHKLVKLCNGTKPPYPAWWEVDDVLIPICCPNNHWFLLQFNIYTLELTIFDRDYSSIPDEFLDEVKEKYEDGLLGFLHLITFFGRGRQSIGAYPVTNVAQVSQYPGSNENSALYVCMFIDRLLRFADEDYIRSDVSEEIVQGFRQRMANCFYSKRTA